MAPPKVAPRASVVEAAKATGKLARRSSVVKEHSPMDGPPPLAAAMLPASGVASGEFYWVSDDKSAWVACRCERTGARATLTRPDGSTLGLGADKLGELEPVDAGSVATVVDNLVELDSYSEGAIAYQLGRRYENSEIYTFVGSILVAVNPFQNLPRAFYSEDAMARCLGVERAAQAGGIKPAPHVYATAARAFLGALREKKPQSVLISGESGAGKTETTKKILALIAHATASGDASETSIEKQIMQSNPILESFGNAKTLRNDNSSRFGKWMIIELGFKDTKPAIAGCRIDHYLLETARVSRQLHGERNYHALYMAQTLEASRGLKLKGAAHHAYLSSSGCVAVPGRDEERETDELLGALKDLGFSKDDTTNLFRVVAAVLHAGDVAFDAAAEGDGSVVGDVKTLQLAAEFAGLTDLLGDLERGLTHKEVPQPKGEPILSPLRPEAAADARDALAKALYGRCFSWLVETVDGALEAGGGIKKETLVGVLDIFGFEVFKQNSFEQLCINLANEKLQKHFNDVIFEGEMAIYKEEEVPCDDIVFADNLPCLELLEAPKARGVLSALDEQRVTPGGSDAKFVAVLNDHHADHAHYSKAKPSMSAMCFTVHHFAGPVTYDAVGWLEKNADALLPGLRRCLAKSKNPLVAKLFPPAVEEADAGGRAKKKGNATIASKFKADLGRLDAQLRDTAPHFARCVKPNQLALPGRFENPLVLRQLKYAGLFEAIRIRKAGYAVRVPLEAFVKRYARTLPSSQKAAIRLCDAALSGAGSAVAAADGMRRAYLDAKDLASAQIAVGKTKVFLRDQKVRGLLERKYEKAVEASIKAIQTWMKAQLKMLRTEGSKREARLKKKAAEAARKKREEEAKAAKAKAEAEEAAKQKAIEEDTRAADKAIADANAFLAKLAGLLLHIQTSCRKFLARRFVKRLRVLSALRRALKSADKTDLDAARDKAHAYLAAHASDGDVPPRARGAPEDGRGAGGPVHDHHKAMTDGERAAAKRIATREMHLHHKSAAHESVLDAQRRETTRKLDAMCEDNRKYVDKHDFTNLYWRV
ncbi:myosin-like protein [Aureococcus anophagefferens]|uniref:Myosin-like protein n=1 Tax=Aureococcus anophagefferens TaxID=44056 RepID=A0ABR1FVZ8_AURAN